MNVRSLFLKKISDLCQQLNIFGNSRLFFRSRFFFFFLHFIELVESLDDEEENYSCDKEGDEH